MRHDTWQSVLAIPRTVFPTGARRHKPERFVATVSFDALARHTAKLIYSAPAPSSTLKKGPYLLRVSWRVKESVLMPRSTTLGKLDQRGRFQAFARAIED